MEWCSSCPSPWDTPLLTGGLLRSVADVWLLSAAAKRHPNTIPNFQGCVAFRKQKRPRGNCSPCSLPAGFLEMESSTRLLYSGRHRGFQKLFPKQRLYRFKTLKDNHLFQPGVITFWDKPKMKIYMLILVYSVVASEPSLWISELNIVQGQILILLVISRWRLPVLIPQNMQQHKAGWKIPSCHSLFPHLQHFQLPLSKGQNPEYAEDPGFK